MDIREELVGKKVYTPYGKGIVEAAFAGEMLCVRLENNFGALVHVSEVWTPPPKRLAMQVDERMCV